MVYGELHDVDTRMVLCLILFVFRHRVEFKLLVANFTNEIRFGAKFQMMIVHLRFWNKRVTLKFALNWLLFAFI